MTKITRIALIGVAVCGLLVAGCAYFNTLYNAKVRYREAEKEPLDREGNVSRGAAATYQEVIEKCHKMIRTWPESRHVDDARLLIVRSYFGGLRYEKAVAAADTLLELHPKTNLLPQTLAIKGIALARSESHEKAVDVLVNRYRTYGPTPGVLSSLCKSLMSLDRNDEAVEYLSILEKEYPNHEETFDARIAIAEILAEKDHLEQSRVVYERLTSDRIPEAYRYRIWMGYADVDARLERFEEALASLEEVKALTLTPQEEPVVLLLQADAELGADSLDAAVETYKDIVGRFSRGEFAAEANYRLGTINEQMDSLETAVKFYNAVPQAYANSQYAQDALRRSNNLSQLMKLEAAENDESPEAQALRTFSMAELQLFQFENVDKALASYQKLLNEYPETDLAPKAAYAVGYIYGTVLADSARAWESYRLLVNRYPDSQQAGYADQIIAMYGGAERRQWIAPVDSMRTVARPPAAADSTRGTPPPAAADTTRAKAPPAAADSTAEDKRVEQPGV